MANHLLKELRHMLEQDLAWGPREIVIPKDHEIQKSFGAIYGTIDKLAGSKLAEHAIGIGFNKLITIPARDKSGAPIFKIEEGQKLQAMIEVTQPLKLRLSKLLRILEVLDAAGNEDDAERAVYLVDHASIEVHGIPVKDGQFLRNETIQANIAKLTEDDIGVLMGGVEQAIYDFVGVSQAAHDYRVAEKAKPLELRVQEASKRASAKAQASVEHFAAKAHIATAPVAGAAYGTAIGIGKGLLNCMPSGFRQRVGKMAADAKSLVSGNSNSILSGKHQFVIVKDDNTNLEA